MPARQSVSQPASPTCATLNDEAAKTKDDDDDDDDDKPVITTRTTTLVPSLQNALSVGGRSMARAEPNVVTLLAGIASTPLTHERTVSPSPPTRLINPVGHSPGPTLLLTHELQLSYSVTPLTDPRCVLTHHFTWSHRSLTHAAATHPPTNSLSSTHALSTQSDSRSGTCLSLTDSCTHTPPGTCSGRPARRQRYLSRGRNS